MEPPPLTPRPYDARRLDCFLNSFWGQQLFNCSGRTRRPRSLTGPKYSPEFMSTSRETPAPNTFFGTTSPSHVLDRLREVRTDSNHTSVLPAIRQLHSLRQDLAYEAVPGKCELPQTRRRNLGAVKLLREKHRSLQDQRFAWLKQTRLAANEPPTNLEREDVQQFRRDSPERLGLLRKFRSSSTKVYFGDAFNNTALAGRGPRRVESEMPQHYHDTHSALFDRSVCPVNPSRLARLSYLWKGGRDYNIINGVEGSQS